MNEYSQPIIVRNLRVESISDPTPDPYGQPGFSVLTAYVNVNDAALVDRLRWAADEGVVVVIKCAALEVEGRVIERQFSDGKSPSVISILVDDLRYLKPRRVPEMVRQNPVRKGRRTE
jgi:hypothetical protein